jgi:tetratricopeptide (TPR) repeat protein
MGLLDAVTQLVANSGRSWLRQQQIRYSELTIRAEIERARAELRLGNVASCDTLLASAARRIEATPDPPAPTEPPAPAESEGPPPQPSDSTEALASRPQKQLAPPSPPELPASSPPRRALLRAVILSLCGQSMRARRRTDRANELFQQAVSAFETVDDDVLTPRDHGDFGIALAAIGRYKHARTHLDIAVGADGAPPEYARELAGILVQLNKHQKAEQLIEEALLALPADPQLYLLRAEVQKARRDPVAAHSFVHAGHLLLNAGRPTDALHAFEQAEPLQPSSNDAIALRAEALRLLSRYDEALVAFDRALAADDSAWLRIRRAATLTSLGDRNRGLADLDHAIKLAPRDIDVLLLASEIQRNEGNGVAAGQFAQSALAIAPDNWRAIELGAEIRSDSGDLPGALELVRSARDKDRGQPTLLRLHARLALATGHRQEAIEMLERLQSSASAEVTDAFQYASLLADDGRVSEALAVTAKGIDAWPDDLNLRMLMVELQLAQGDHQTGLSEARAIIDLQPEHPGGHLLYAAALVAQPPPFDEETTRDALAAAARSAELAERWAEPWWIRAQILWWTGDQDGAKTALDQVFRRDPGHRQARRLAVEIRLSAEELDAAERLARELVSQAPEDADSLMLLAKVLSARRRPGEALSFLMNPAVETVGRPVDRAERLLLRAELRTAMHAYTDADKDLAVAADLAPRQADVWIQRATVARLLGNGDAAMTYAESALELDRDNLAARIELVAVHLMRHEADKAEPIVDQMLRRWPGDVRVRLLHAQTLADRQPHLAREELARLAEAHPENPAVASVKAQSELNRAEYQAALDTLARVPDLETDADMLALRAEALRLHAQPAKAIRDAARCLELAPAHSGGLATLGLALMDTGEADRAVEVFKRATDAYPRDSLAKTRLGRAYTVVDRFDEGLRLLDEAALAVPANSWVTSQLADALAETGLFGQAATLYQRVCDRPEADAAAWNGLGWSLEHLSSPDLKRAEAAFNKAFELDADDMWIRQRLADIYHQRGERARAHELYAGIVESALARRAEHTGYLSLAAWCSFRLGDLEAAARRLYEATSTQDRTSSDHFDLAMIHLCAGRIRRGASMYENIIPLTDRHPQRRRGLLAVALADLRQAQRDFPNLSSETQMKRVLDLLTKALGSVPAPPPIRALAEAAPTVGKA